MVAGSGQTEFSGKIELDPPGIALEIAELYED